MEAVQFGWGRWGLRRDERVEGGRELKTWRFQFLHKYLKTQDFKRFRHARNNLNRCAVNDSIQTRQTRSVRAQQRWGGSILPFLLNLFQCICTPTLLIPVTLTPRSWLHPSLGVLIYSTIYHYAFPDCARKILETCSLECQRVAKKNTKNKKVATVMLWCFRKKKHLLKALFCVRYNK